MSALAVTLTVDELHDLIRKAVRAEVGGSGANEVMDRDECAKLVGVEDPRTLVRWVEQGGMPGKKLPGGLWRFRRSLVLAWLSENGKTLPGKEQG